MLAQCLALISFEDFQISPSTDTEHFDGAGPKFVYRPPKMFYEFRVVARQD